MRILDQYYWINNIDEDPVTLVALVNIAATDLKAVLNAKNDERFSPNATIRKVWIPKHYLIHRDELAAKRRTSTTKEKEKNGRYPYHSNKKSRRRNPLKKRMFLQKRDIFS